MFGAWSLDGLDDNASFSVVIEEFDFYSLAFIGQLFSAWEKYKWLIRTKKNTHTLWLETNSQWSSERGKKKRAKDIEMIYRTIQNDDIFETISNPTILQQFNNNQKKERKK